MVQFLIDLDANPDMIDKKGRTPAMKAAELGHIQVFEMLVEAETSLLGMWYPSLLSNHITVYQSANKFVVL